MTRVRAAPERLSSGAAQQQHPVHGRRLGDGGYVFALHDCKAGIRCELFHQITGCGAAHVGEQARKRGDVKQLRCCEFALPGRKTAGSAVVGAVGQQIGMAEHNAARTVTGSGGENNTGRVSIERGRGQYRPCVQGRIAGVNAQRAQLRRGWQARAAGLIMEQPCRIGMFQLGAEFRRGKAPIERYAHSPQPHQRECRIHKRHPVAAYNRDPHSVPDALC